jgi:chromosome segregation ATPase
LWLLERGELRKEVEKQKKEIVQEKKQAKKDIHSLEDAVKYLERDCEKERKKREEAEAKLSRLYRKVEQLQSDLGTEKERMEEVESLVPERAEGEQDVSQLKRWVVGLLQERSALTLELEAQEVTNPIKSPQSVF